MQYFTKKNYIILGVLYLLYVHAIFCYDFNVLLGLNLPCVIKIYIFVIITLVNSCMMNMLTLFSEPHRARTRSETTSVFVLHYIHV